MPHRGAGDVLRSRAARHRDALPLARRCRHAGRC